ncbi:MAG: hypothetical protein WCT10_04230 [Patescibacteria group bacterium]
MDLFPKLFPNWEARRRWKLTGPESFRVYVDPNVPIDDLVRQAGFDGIKIYSHEPFARPWSEIYPVCHVTPYVRDFEILGLDGSLWFPETDQALADLAQRGYRPADAHEFLSFLAQHPHRLRRQCDITALGATYRDQDLVFNLSLWDRPYRRTYDLYFILARSKGFASGWSSYHRFLATRLEP